jgi:hypothetical protein
MDRLTLMIVLFFSVAGVYVTESIVYLIIIYGLYKIERYVR